MLKYIASDWTAYGHSVKFITSDSEPVLKSLIPMFGAKQITHTLIPAGQHAQRLERIEQALINLETAIRANMTCYLPQHLDVFVKE